MKSGFLTAIYEPFRFHLDELHVAAEPCRRMQLCARCGEVLVDWYGALGEVERDGVTGIGTPDNFFKPGVYVITYNFTAKVADPTTWPEGSLEAMVFKPCRRRALDVAPKAG